MHGCMGSSWGIRGIPDIIVTFKQWYSWTMGFIRYGVRDVGLENSWLNVSNDALTVWVIMAGQGEVGNAATHPIQANMLATDL